MKKKTGRKNIIAAILLSAVALTCLLGLGAASSAADHKVAKGAYATSDNFTWNGYELRFKKSEVLTAFPLDDDASPTGDVVTRDENGAMLSWKPAKNKRNIDGYVILRKKADQEEFVEIGRTGNRAKSYLDSTVGSDEEVRYTLVGYKMKGKLMKISACSGCEMFPRKRAYQNPDDCIRITDRISTHGYNYYTAPVLVNRNSTKEDHIEAMIVTALRYLGDPYKNRHSTKPGEGLDCSGLIMQAAYGAGVDLWPSNPYRHLYGEERYEWESREISNMDTLKTIPYEKRKRGDLIFYTHGDDVVTHVALYLGDDMVIHSYKKGVGITEIDYNPKTNPYLVKRIFN